MWVFVCGGRAQRRGNMLTFEKTQWRHYWHHQLSWGQQKNYQWSVTLQADGLCVTIDHTRTHWREKWGKYLSHCHWKFVINRQKHKERKKMTLYRKTNKRQREEGKILCLCYDGLENIQESSAGVYQLKWKNKKSVSVIGILGIKGKLWWQVENNMHFYCVQKCNCSEHWLNIVYQVIVCTMIEPHRYAVLSLQGCATCGKS